MPDLSLPICVFLNPASRGMMMTKSFFQKFFRALYIGRSSQVPAGVPRNREKLPLSTPKNESNLTRNWDFCEKMWHLSKSKDVILLYELTNIPKIAAPKGELQSPDEETTTFSQKYPSFEYQIRLLFWGRKWQFSFAEKSAKYLRVLEEKWKVREIVNKIFPQKKCRFRPQKTSRIQR